ncbi:SpoIIE family protein phosphatase [Streptomyces sp. PSKA54]|uniref:protein-serine/threonine phosphatase n=1 Tax=Streptomyces himalayensis subsp. aureolus TaxID=2758039 RepID=A0A7W2D2Q6_9ACTN|nr:SpoIIE family protein phosphatase [Streptomyces himalayensis]MBA4863633.1 SpoIIE family protein phosphatase [Streptomyces himalayensis subsp. aureolus]
MPDPRPAGDRRALVYEQAGAWWDVLPVAVLVLDGGGRIVQWAMAAGDLLGYTPEEVLGRDSTDFVLPEGRAAARSLREAVAAGRSSTGSFPVRHKSGRTVQLEVWACPVAGAGRQGRDSMLWLVADAREAQSTHGGRALPEGWFSGSPVGLAVLDTDLRFQQVNPALEAMNGVPASAHLGRRLAEVLPGVNSEQMEAAMRRVLDTGEPMVNFRRIGRTPADPHRDRVWSCSYFRLDDRAGRPLGISASIVDITADQRDDVDSATARRRVTILNEATLRVGSTLDVARTGQELADLTVPRLADIVTVDVLRTVTEAAEPLAGLAAGAALRRLGKAPAYGSVVADVLAPVGRILHFPAVAPYAQALVDRRPYLLAHVDARAVAPAARYTSTPDRIRRLGVHSLMMVPLIARGLVLGVATFLRADEPTAFDSADLALAGDLAAHAAICIDNARLYHREHDTALTLQRSMLPRRPQAPAGMEIAHCYRPASDVNEIGGDWYDVTEIAPDRAALVIGDVMGHGITAAAVMGQMRTTVRALSRLDLPPDQLLDHLDHAMQELDDPLLATCLYAVCDTSTHRCRFARAGHPPPAVITPDGTARLLDLPPGAPLGIGGITYTTTEVAFPPGSLLVLYTDGLIEARGHDLDERLSELTDLLGHTGQGPPGLCDTLVTHLAATPAEDDIAILIARIGTPEGSPRPAAPDSLAGR